ncbi:MAG: DNA mismatch repair endonuclease MutL [Methanothrix sp.]|nr:DNA mismatch repair endonuclease MutL [Methanothrix sp.]
MAQIRLLDEETINKIAAGEVIERPASVVKELVENSIDAGAGRIIVEAVDGGRSLIRVTDDGCGMEPEDLPVAFQRHATSKIRDARDLEGIRTLGFRGEALASIASVSRCIEVSTRIHSAISGTQMLIEDGGIVRIAEAGCPAGTSISVRDLFYNVPARRKHLKGPEAELVHIADVVTEMAIINHRVSFELFTGKRVLFRSVRSETWDDVLLRVFGLRAFRSMAKIESEGRGWRILGAVGDPLSTRSSPDRIFIYVNGRPVASRSLSGAVREAYRNLIPSGRSPQAVISLQIDPQLVDVNVHPTKREIRLLREEEISTALRLAVSEALSSGKHLHAVPEQAPQTGLPKPDASIAHACEQRALPLEAEERVEEGLRGQRRSMRILGQVMDLYIVAEGDEGLVLIDQHAAAERIRFEHLLDRYSRRRIKQELAEPVILELSPGERILVESWHQTLEEIGFEIIPFGANTISVRSVPALGRRLEDASAIHDILRDLFSSGRATPGSQSREELLKLLACRGSIKSGRRLGLAEMERLVRELYACKNPLTCPHGRPVVVVLDEGMLGRLFSRR